MLYALFQSFSDPRFDCISGPQQPPQQGFYPQPQFNPQQSGQWNQQQQGQGQGYYQPNFYYPGQFPQQGQHIPPAASQNLGRSGSQSGPHPPSNLPGAAPPANGARPGTPGSQVGSPPPNSSPYRNFNPGASEFSPNPNAFFQPRAESKGIRISKPPATTPSKAIPIKAPPSKASEGSAPSNADKDDAAAASKQQEESDKKASKEKDAAEDEAAKLKTAQEAEAKAKEDAEAKAKAEAEEADRKRKLEEEQQRKAQEEAEKARKDKEEADKKAQQEQEAAAAEKKKAEQEEAEKAAREAAAAQEAKQAAAQEAKQATAEVTPEPASATKPAEETSKTPQTPAEVTASTNESLKTAKAIENLKDVQYPESVSSSRAELNENATPGQYFYEREFLLQFMNVCRERPDALPSLEAIGMADADGSVYTPAGGHSAGSGGMSRQTSYGGRGRAGGSSSRQSSMSGQPRSGNYPPPMGAFNSAPAKTSQERFAQSMQNTGFGSGGSFGRPGPGGRQNSMLGGMGMGNIAGSNRRSERGSKRGNPRGAAHQPQETFDSLTRNQNAWTPDIQSKAAAAAGPSDPLAPELVQRKVKALLNKLTVDNFDSISTQLLEWANKSEQEQDGRILRQVIALIFEKATDEAAWSEMYARLARKASFFPLRLRCFANHHPQLQDCISQNVTDVTMTSKEAVAPAGGSLFRKYLLNRCQEDYEKGWSERQRTASAAAASADADKAKLESNEAAKAEAEKAGESGAKKDEPQEAEILSDEYYAAQKAKRRGLGLVRFIGELYKLNMLYVLLNRTP